MFGPGGGIPFFFGRFGERQLEGSDLECVAVLAVACGCHCDVLRMFEAANGLNGELAWNGYRPECGGYSGGHRCVEEVVFSEVAQDG